MAYDFQDTEVNEKNASELLLRAEAMAELADRLKDNVKVFAERGGVVKDPATGKVYLPTQCKGKMGLDQEAAIKAGFDVSKFQKRGKPFLQFGWRKQ
jgi:hypothetical protein